MSEQSVIGVYESMSKAEEAIRKLDHEKFPIRQISVIGQNVEHEKEVCGYVTVEDVARQGVSTGALAGGLFGLVAGVASIWIPGLGRMLVAGPIAAVLLGLLGSIEGAVTGAAWGGVLATLVGWGVSRQHMIKYEEHLKAGKYLVIAHGSAEELERAHSILHSTEAEHLQLHNATQA
jgi:uncharacterized membrane protein